MKFQQILMKVFSIFLRFLDVKNFQAKIVKILQLCFFNQMVIWSQFVYIKLAQNGHFSTFKTQANVCMVT